MREIGEPGEIRAQCSQVWGRLAIASQRQLELQITPARALEQQLPRVVWPLSMNVRQLDAVGSHVRARLPLPLCERKVAQLVCRTASHRDLGAMWQTRIDQQPVPRAIGLLTVENGCAR